MKKILLILIFLSIVLFSHSQSWQWGIRGGGFSNGLNLLPYESVVDMATDPNGNLYTLSVIEASGNPTLGSALLNKWGNRDILLSSFTCAGSVRWKKVIGSTIDDHPKGLSVDSLGNVYAVGWIFNDAHVDTDSAFPNPNYKKVYIVRYDTSGNFKWIRQPSSDTASMSTHISYTQVYDVVSDGAGNAMMLCYLRPGLLSGGSHVIDSAGYYLLKYDPQGVVSGVTPFQMKGVPSFTSIRLSRTSIGKLLLSGSINLMSSAEPLFVAGQQISTSMFIFCFDSQGQFLWKKLNAATTVSSGFYHRPAFDASGNIFLGGTTYPGDSFNGYTFTGTSGFPFLTKLDSNGNSAWIKQGITNAATYGTGITLANNKVYLVGDYPGSLVWDSYRYQNPPNNDYDIFLTTFDAQTGNVITIDSLESNFGVFDISSSVTSDKFGNVYVGGGFGSQLPVGTTTLINSGGNTDLFIAKYGSANCSSVLPLSLLRFTATLRDQLVYCQWQTVFEQNTSHFFLERSTNGQQFLSISKIDAAGNSNSLRSYSYEDRDALGQMASKRYYRLRMVDMDGSYRYSNTETIQMPATPGIFLAPNPSSGATQLVYRFQPAGDAVNTVAVYNAMGQMVFDKKVKVNGTLQLNLYGQPSGIYLVTLKQNGAVVQTKQLIINR